jgi:hypothetical protein
MKVIEAVNREWPIWEDSYPWVFMAGGITNCPDWQQDMIEKLNDVNKGILYNPRRKNFPIEDPNASKEQIEWEFDAIEACDIFTMWFSKGESDQPICMYELGRNLARYMMSEFADIVIGVEEGYRRQNDVLIQVGLVDEDIVIHRTFDDYIEAVRKSVLGFEQE